MQSKPNGHELAEQIEALISNFLAESHAAAKVALERAFAITVPRQPAQRQRGPKTKARQAATASPRHDPGEMAPLAERLYAAICERPGEPMTALAAAIGVTPSELQVPAGHLRRAGKIRSVGCVRDAVLPDAEGDGLHGQGQAVMSTSTARRAQGSIGRLAGAPRHRRGVPVSIVSGCQSATLRVT